MADLINCTRNAVLRGTEWLIRRQNADGSFSECGDELVSTYKAPLAFAVSGNTEAGVRCLEYIKTHNLNGEGELSSAGGGVKTTFPNNQRNFANYMDGWVAIGAWLLGDFGFAARICERLLPQQAAHGGILTGPEKWSGTPRFDVLTNASLGRAFLHTGMRDKARSVADFLAQVVAPQHQRTPKEAFDMSFDVEWNHVEPLDPKDRPYYRLLYSQRGERVFCPAFACAFLCEMARLDNQVRYLGAAREYLSVITRTPEFLDQSLANGKSGWAAGMLAVASRDESAKQAALQIMPKMLARQREDGEFAAASGADQTPLAKRLESTAEHVAWALQYQRLLALGL
jgi:hypothetical protein